MPPKIRIRSPSGGPYRLVTPEEYEALKTTTAGVREVSPEELGTRGAAAADALTREAYDTAADEALTLVEGILDAASVGIIRETGELADIRRDVNPVQAFVGEAIGTVGSLVYGGPAGAVMRTGERAGAAIAKQALRQSEGIIARGLTEAGAGAAFTGVQSFNHQLLNSVLEDKDFSAEAVIDDAKLGLILGGAGGAVGGILSKVANRATRSEVAAQGGLLGGADEALTHYKSALKAYDEVLETHAQRLGALDTLKKAGGLGGVADDFLPIRRAALKDAEAAGKALKELDIERALDGADPGAYRAFQAAQARYHATTAALDDIMVPHTGERVAAKQFLPDEIVSLNEPGPLKPQITQQFSDPVLQDLDARMAASPELQAQYTALHGRPYEPNFIPASPEVPGNPFTTPLGGTRTATSELGTMGGSPRALQPSEPTPAISEAQPVQSGTAGFESTGPPGPVGPPGPPGIDSGVNLTQRPRPWDLANTKIRNAMDDMYRASKGRLDSAKSLGILEASGIKPAMDPITSQVDGLWAARRAGRMAADEARGVATPLRQSLGEYVKTALLGHAVVGGPAGAIMALATTKLGLPGKLASASGKLSRAIAKAGGKLLTPTVVKAGTVAAANTPWSYSDRGPIADPVERIQEIRYLANNPQAITARVRATAGDLAEASPELVDALDRRAVGQVMALSVAAPAIAFDRLGRALSPPAGQLREFFEFENGIHDLPGLLKAVETSSLTKPQAAALQRGWASAHGRLVAQLLASPDDLANLPKNKLKTIELITGAPLTGASDPQFLTRQVMAWAPQEQPAPPKPQAFNINPAGPAMPTQSPTGRAPGN